MSIWNNLTLFQSLICTFFTFLRKEIWSSIEYHLRFAVETWRKRSISEANHNCNEKSELCTMLNANNHRVDVKKQLKTYRKLISIKRRWCSLFGWKGMVFWAANKQLNDWFDCVLPPIGQIEWFHQAEEVRTGEQKRCRVFHYDNARLHTSLVTCQKLLELGWDMLLHPPYSPDLTPSEYYLFRSLQNSLDNKTFDSLLIDGAINYLL